MSKHSLAPLLLKPYGAHTCECDMRGMRLGIVHTNGCALFQCSTLYTFYQFAHLGHALRRLVLAQTGEVVVV
jgi:hypothetical protein